jgi:hypothetical protein
MAEAIAPNTGPVAVPPPSAVPPAEPGITSASERVVAPKAIDMQAEFDNASMSSDPAKMMRIAQLAKGSPIEDAAINSAKRMEANKTTFDGFADRIAKAGGPDSPSGRLEVANATKYANEHEQNMIKAPGFWEALSRRMMGDKEAYKYVDGGVVTPQLRYGKNNGQALEVWQDQLGRTRNVIDAISRQPISREEYGKIGIGMVDMTQTLGYKTQDEIRKYNADKLNQSNARANAYEAASNEKQILYANQEKWLQSLSGSGLSNESLQYLAGLSSRQIGFTQNLAEGQNAFDQFSRNKGENVSESVTKSAKAHVANLAKFFKLPLSLGADGSVKDDKGNTYGSAELNNLQNTFSKNVNYEQNFSQAKAEAEKSAVYQGLKKEQKDIFDSVLENSRKIAAKEAELIKDHGTLPFLVNPSAFQTADQFKRGEIQGIAGQFNAEASKLYSEWRKVQLQKFEKYGQVPTAGELEANFIKQPEYLQLKSQYQEQEAAVRARPEKFAPTIPEAQGSINAPGLAQGSVNRSAPSVPVPTQKGRAEERNAELIKKHTSGR